MRRRIRFSLDALRRRGMLFYLFDALDEIPTADAKERWTELRLFAQDATAHHNRVVFSCRELEYERSFNADEVLLAPFDERRVRRFITAYLAPRHAEHLPALAEHLLDPANELRRLVVNPFYLVMFVIFLNTGQNYEQDLGSLLRGGSLKPVFDRLMRNTCVKARERGALQEGDEEAFEEMLAILALRSWGTDACRPWECLYDVTERHSESKVKRALSASLAEGILVVDESGRYLFRHHRLQEYLAAAALARMKTLPNVGLGMPLRSPALDETLVLYASMVDDLEPLITALLEEPPTAGSGPLLSARHHARMMGVAARCVAAHAGGLSDVRSRLEHDFETLLTRGQVPERVEAIVGLSRVVHEETFVDRLSSIVDPDPLVQEEIVTQLQNCTSGLRGRTRLMWKALQQVTSVTILAGLVWRNARFLRVEPVRVTFVLALLCLVKRLLQPLAEMTPGALVVMWASHRTGMLVGPMTVYLLATPLVRMAITLNTRFGRIMTALVSSAVGVAIAINVRPFPVTLPVETWIPPAHTRLGVNAPELGLARELLLLSVVILMAILYLGRVRLTSAIAQPPMSLASRILDQRFGPLVPPLLTGLVVYEGVRLHPPAITANLVAMSGGGIVAVGLILLAVSLFRAHGQFEFLMRSLDGGRATDSGQRVVEYLSGRAASLYKMRVARQLSNIAEPDADLIEQLWKIGTRGSLRGDVQGELWRSTKELESRLWRRLDARRGIR